MISEAEDFAIKLSEIINGTVSSKIEFKVTPILDKNFAWVSAGLDGTLKPILIPISCNLKDGDEPWMWLNVSFKVSLIKLQYLTVESSVVSLVIDDKSRRPVFRVEFDRDRGVEPSDLETGRHARNAAHVQIHGASPELSYIHGRNGLPKVRTLEDHHFPVGGRRFRPTLEDFIEFIYLEQLVPNLHQGWREVINKHRSDWLDIQLKAAVREKPHIAIEKLIDMGYTVRGPSVET